MTKYNKEDLISIIMPAFNCEKYIEDSINSVLNQTYRKWELIVIDDGSSDNTVRIVEMIANKDNRIKFLKNNQNRGVSATRNRAISLAIGEWIAFLDSDDIWESAKLDKQMTHAQKLNAEFLFTGSAYINDFGEYYQGIFEVPERVDYRKLRTHNVISCSSVLIKKRFVENIKMEKDDIHEDFAVWLRVLRTGISAYGVNEPLLVYRISRYSKSGNKKNTIKMTYQVYRCIGINPVGSAYFMLRHILGSLKKYRKIIK